MACGLQRLTLYSADSSFFFSCIIFCIKMLFRYFVQFLFVLIMKCVEEILVLKGSMMLVFYTQTTVFLHSMHGSSSCIRCKRFLHWMRYHGSTFLRKRGSLKSLRGLRGELVFVLPLPNHRVLLAQW